MKIALSSGWLLLRSSVLPITSLLLLCLGGTFPSHAQAWPTTDLTLWLKADAGVTADAGGVVSAWNDQSSRANHLAQSDANRRPRRLDATLNGLPVLEFREDWLVRGGVPGASLFAGAATTVFLVQRQLGSDARTTTLSWVGPNDQRCMVHATYDNTIAFQVGRPTSGGEVILTQPPGWDDAWHLLSFRRDGNSGQIRSDRVAVTSGATFTSVGDPSGTASLYVASDPWNNTFNGEIAEVLVFASALSDTDLLAVEQYLQTKWGFPVTAAAVPDLLVKAAAEPDPAYAGDNVYQATPAGAQVRSLTVAPLRSAAFRVRAANDGPLAKPLVLRAAESATSGWSVTYRIGTVDVSSAALSTAGFTTGSIDPGQHLDVDVAITVNGVVPAGGTKTVTLQASDDYLPSLVRDAVRLEAVAGSGVRPDLAIRRDIDPVAAGEGIYNADGAGQTRWVSTINSASATAHVTLGNDGNAPLRARVIGGGSGAGWTARYETSHALAFDGVDDYVDLGAWAPGSKWSVEARVKPTALPGGRHTIAGGANDCRDWGIILQDGKFGLPVRPPSGCWAGYFSATPAQANVWYQVTATCDGTTASLYVNGELQASGPASDYQPTSAGTRIGGEFCCPGGVFTGVIDDVRIWNRALSAAEVLAGVATEPDPAAEGLAGYWRLDDGSPWLVRDLTPNQRHGSLVNGPVWVRKDITSEVTGAGWTDHLIGGGGATELVVTLTPDPTVPGGTTRDLTLTAAALPDAALLDTVRLVASVVQPSTSPVNPVFTTTAQFESGVMSGLDAQSVPDQLQLAAGSGVLPHLWVPNSSDQTVSKIDTRTGRELARYRVAPSGVNGNPSRTTVDLRGSCWVANRNSGTVVKIGLLEQGGYADRNADGVIQTSRDLNNDGVISGAEVLDWGQDECVLHEVHLVPGREARYAPGAYPGPYPDNYWNPGPRGLAVDAQGHLWAGAHDSRKYYTIDGETGLILRILDVSSADHTAYGSAIDARGILWSSGYKESGAQNLLRLDTSDASFRAIPVDFHTYGVALDRNDHLFVTGHQEAVITRWNTLTATREWTVGIGALSRGLAVTDDGDVWVVSSGPGTVTRLSNNGVKKAVIAAGSTPTGVAVDPAGKVWVMGSGDEYLRRIDPGTDMVDLVRRVAGSHYGYSDMTGMLVRNTTVRQGLWSRVHDAQVPNTAWERVQWQAVDPAGHQVQVRVRSSNDGTGWSPWETAGNGSVLRATPPGRYLELEATLTGTPGVQSPVLQSISANGQAPAATDLAVRLQASPNPVSSEYPQACVVAVTNRSATWASGLRITHRFPEFTDVLAVEIPGGFYQRNGNTFVCSLAGLAPQAEARITFRTTPLRPGNDVLEAVVTANEEDPVPANNTASLMLASLPVPCTEPLSGAVAWWSGEGDARDSAGTADLAVEGGPAFAAGKVGTGFIFDSNDDRLTTPHRDAFNLNRSGFTAQFWMRAPADQPGQSDNLVTLLEKSHGWADYSGWAFQVSTTTGTLGFTAGSGGGAGHAWVTLSSLGSVRDGRWHHVAGTWDGYTLRLLVDGILQQEALLMIPAGNTRPVNVGFTWGNGSPRRFFRGQLDEVSLHHRALTVPEITRLHAARSGGVCRADPFVHRPAVMPEAIVGEAVSLPLGAMFGTAPYQYELAHGSLPPGLALSPAGLITGRPAQAGTYSFTIHVADAAGGSSERSFTQRVSACTAVPAGLVGRWTADEGTDDTAGFRHGTLEYQAGFATGRVGRAFVFDGGEDALRLPGSSSGALDLTGNQLTLMMWLNLAATSPPAKAFQCLFDKYYDGSRNGYALSLDAGKLLFQVATADNREFGLVVPDFPLQRWVHVAATYDGTRARLFLDGVEAAAAPLTGHVLHNNHDAAIGNDNWPGSREYAANGLLDEIEVYQRGLTSAEVEAAFAAGAAGRCPQTWADLLVKRATDPDTGYGADNAYFTAPDASQTRTQSAAPLVAAGYDLRVENDSAETRTYNLRAVESAEPDWEVEYLAAGVDVSGAMRSATGYTTGPLAPGSAQVIRVGAAPGLSRPAQASRTVTVAAYRDSGAATVLDTVRLVTLAATSQQPDLMIRRDFDDSFAGERVFNATGLDQARLLEVGTGGTAEFLLQLRNHGNVPGRIRLTATPDTDGWTTEWCGGRPYLEFNGNGQFVRLPNQPSLRPTSLTIEGWYNFSALGGSRVLFGKAVGGSTDNSYVMWHEGGFLRGYAAGSGQVNKSWSPTPGTWYHLAYVFDDAANRHALYLDGVEVASGTANGSLTYDDHPPLMGADFQGANPSEFFAGRMSEVRFWNVVRTPAQIAGARHQRLAGHEPGLVGYWRLDEGAGTVAPDHSAKGHDGTLVAGPVWGAADAPAASCLEVTEDLAGPGGLVLTLDAKATYGLNLRVTPGPTVPPGTLRDVVVTATSLEEASAVDVVRAGVSVFAPPPEPVTTTYTTATDFLRGRLSGVETIVAGDRLQLSDRPAALRYLWVPNSEGTISKVDTLTARELARYRTCPVGVNGQPSRTTVDLIGNCYVANRYAGTIVKVGLLENGQYIDRNGDGLVQTSTDRNGDGDITADEMLPWGQDECVLWEVSVIPGLEGSFVPGTFPGPYRNEWGFPGARGVGIDAAGNVWVGTLDTKLFYYLDATTGVILRKIDVSSVNHRTYGAVIDRNGILWASSHDRNEVLRLDPVTGQYQVIPLGHFSYGINVDRQGHVFVSGWQSSRLTRIDSATAAIEWTIPADNEGRGIAVTEDGDVWVAYSGPGLVVRRSNAGVFKASIPVGSGPTGVAVDSRGMVWCMGQGEENIRRIDPARNVVDLVKRIACANVEGYHYGYSDMTGTMARNSTTRIGFWKVTHDSGHPNTPWGAILWEATVPEGTALTVRVRSANEGQPWSLWEEVANGVPFHATPPGQYLEVEARLQSRSLSATPVLQGLTIQPARDANYGLLVYENTFEGPVGGEWSAPRTATTPRGNLRFLGEFGNETVALTLANLPPHAAATVMVDQFVIRSWDGNSTGAGTGPDVWEMNVGGGLKLVHTTYDNGPAGSTVPGQAFPGTHPGAEHPARTGAAENNTLGFLVPGAGVADAVYPHLHSFPHTAGTLVLNFIGSGLGPLAEESWGLDNVRVFLVPAGGPPELTAVGPELAGFKVRAIVQPGWLYTWETSPDLKSWTPQQSVRATTHLLEFADPAGLTEPYRFYRLLQQP